MNISAISSIRRAVSLILKCIVVITAAAGIYLSATGGFGTFMSGRQVFMYFTIQSNILIALICAVGAILLLRKTDVKNGWFIVKYVGTVSITLTGTVFSFVLAPTLGKDAWTLHNILTHVVVPIASIADFFVTGIYGDIQKKHVVFVTLPPLAYGVYASVGYVMGWEFSLGKNFPYFFLNWGSPAGAFGFTDGLPYFGCAWWILIITAAVFAVGFVYLLILNAMKRAHQKRMAS